MKGRRSHLSRQKTLMEPDSCDKFSVSQEYRTDFRRLLGEMVRKGGAEA